MKNRRTRDNTTGNGPRSGTNVMMMTFSGGGGGGVLLYEAEAMTIMIRTILFVIITVSFN